MRGNILLSFSAFSGWYIWFTFPRAPENSFLNSSCDSKCTVFFSTFKRRRKTWCLRSIPGHSKYIPWRNICRLPRCFYLPSIVSNNNQQNSLYKVPPSCATSHHALDLIFGMKRSSFNTHYFFCHYCIDSSWEKSAANHPLMIKSAMNGVAGRCVFGKLIPFPPLSASQPVRVSSVWRVTSPFLASFES